MSDSKSSALFFDPDIHPDDTIKAFEEFLIDFNLRYEASYPDPPKVALDAAMKRWELTNVDKKPTLEQYDAIVNSWKSKDKVAKFLGMYSSRRLYSDWIAALPSESERKNADWNTFVQALRAFYKPTENLTLKHYQFRLINQEKTESFIAFCNRVEKEAKHCELKCVSPACTAQNVAIRDQIVIGTSSDQIREEALKESWGLAELRKEGMRLESASKGAAEISGELKLNKIGKYSRKYQKGAVKADQSCQCYSCGYAATKKEVIAHAKQCPAKKSICTNCNKKGHLAKVCRQPAVNEIKEPTMEEQLSEDESVYQVNVFRVKSTQAINLNDFKVELIINNRLDTVLADTGAAVSVCGEKHARKWGLMDRITKSHVKIKPYKSQAIPILGVSTCGVSVGNRSVPVKWHIIADDCEPILAGSKAVHLGVIKFDQPQKTHMPVQMIKCKESPRIQEILADYPQNFKHLGKLKGHVVRLHIDNNVKPVAEPPRRIPYHLESRVEESISEMLKNDVIEEHPASETAPWTSNVVIAPKGDGDIRITLDAKNVNKALLSSNYPIPRQEDIKARLAGSKYFSKLDLKSAFWQLEIEEESRPLTVFHCLGKMYRYKRLVMGLKPAQGELNAALQPLFSLLKSVHVIHDDIVIATKTLAEHETMVEQVMAIVEKAGLTFKASKCVFAAKEIHFWGLIVSAEGVRPDPAKVEALSHMAAPKDKDELNSFLCMMQSNAEFIPEFSKKAAKLRELTKKSARFSWRKEHQQCFQSLLSSFKKDTLLQFFDGSLPTYVFVDAHHSGLSAILAQGQSLDTARPVALASRTTSDAEKSYPQIDLEATSVDFALRRFREYLVGSPVPVKLITDHKPLVPIFNGRRHGSIRTQRMKLNHQDVPYTLEYQKGNKNIADYLSRHAKPLSKLPVSEQKESHELSNLLYMLHSTPVVDHISIGKIAMETKKDATLSKIQVLLQKGRTSVPKKESGAVRKFNPIMHELTLARNGIILKQERMVLPDSLQSLAIELAHRGSHPGRSGIERRLRYHFFFHDMFAKVKKFVESCEDCSVFVDKKTKEPIRHHKVPNESWHSVSVDLFGPMPSSKHVVVVQDLGSRFPAAKLVTSTKAEKVIPVLKDIYNAYGNPEQQISDNGPPFNSAKMQDFTEKRGIEMRTTPPYFPNANPAEVFMKTVGKTMKTALHSKVSEEEALEQALSNYRQTPHPATGLPPGAVLFRDGMRCDFPRKAVSERQVCVARNRDYEQKIEKEEDVNASKYRKASDFFPGDLVLIRNHNAMSEFDPKFTPEPYTVVDVDYESKKIILQSSENSRKVTRHPDDVKPFYGSKVQKNICSTLLRKTVVVGPTFL